MRKRPLERNPDVQKQYQFGPKWWVGRVFDGDDRESLLTCHWDGTNKLHLVLVVQGHRPVDTVVRRVDEVDPWVDAMLASMPAIPFEGGRAATSQSGAPPPATDDSDDFMGATEAARELGVTMSNLDRVANLPPEHQRLEGGRIWKASVIRRFAAERQARRQANAAR